MTIGYNSPMHSISTVNICQPILSTYERSVPSGARLTLEIVNVSETVAARARKDKEIVIKDDKSDVLSILKRVKDASGPDSLN